MVAKIIKKAPKPAPKVMKAKQQKIVKAIKKAAIITTLRTTRGASKPTKPVAKPVTAVANPEAKKAKASSGFGLIGITTSLVKKQND